MPGARPRRPGSHWPDGACLLAPLFALACAPAEPVAPPEPFAPEPEAEGFLSAPFEGTAAVTTWFDHAAEGDAPISAWGGALQDDVGSSGHRAYDWYLPEGTPVFAAADGKVTFSGIRKPFWCAPLDVGVEDQRAVTIRHEGPDGRKWETSYDHLSEANFRKGDRVVAGDVIGRSGETGCATGPHLHFVVKRVEQDAAGRKRRVRVDPFGWHRDGPDPFGTAHEWLWLPGEAPVLQSWRGTAEGSRILWFVSTGWDDAAHPNNERLVLGKDFWQGPRDCVIRNQRGEEHALPAPTLTGPPTLTLYSGSGEPSPGAGFLGRDSPLWDDAGDCVHLICGGREVEEHPSLRGACSHDGWGPEASVR